MERVAPLFSGEERQALDQVQKLYQESGQLALRTFRDRDVFLGPWSGKKVEDWTKEVREREADLLQAMRERDNRAIDILRETFAVD
ncbi:MAG: hypothetical protein QM770_11845 [Tepidisphaeraceae bacterium]